MASDELYRASTTRRTARNAISHTASQCRPLSLTAHLKGAEPCRAGPRVRLQLVRGRPLRLLGQHPPERPPPARAHGLARRAPARPAPVPGRRRPAAGPAPTLAAYA